MQPTSMFFTPFAFRAFTASTASVFASCQRPRPSAWMVQGQAEMSDPAPFARPDSTTATAASRPLGMLCLRSAASAASRQIAARAEVSAGLASAGMPNMVVTRPSSSARGRIERTGLNCFMAFRGASFGPVRQGRIGEYSSWKEFFLVSFRNCEICSLLRHESLLSAVALIGRFLPRLGPSRQRGGLFFCPSAVASTQVSVMPGMMRCTIFAMSWLIRLNVARRWNRASSM